MLKKWTGQIEGKKKKKPYMRGKPALLVTLSSVHFYFSHPLTIPPMRTFLFWRSFCNFRLNYTLKILFVHISGSSNSMCLKADPSFLPMACTHSSSCIPHLGSNSYIFHGTQTKISAFPSPYQLVTKSCIICLLGISSDCACFPSSLAIKTLTFSCLGNTI